VSSAASLASHYGLRAAKAWRIQPDKVLTFLNLVMENNPRKPLEDILVRPDVQLALTQPFSDAASQTVDLMDSAWRAGSKIGSEEASKMLKDLGLEGVQKGKASVSTLNSLKADVWKNSASAKDRLIEAMQGDREGLSDRLGKVTRDLQRRATIGIDVAVKESYAQSAMATYAQNGAAGKTWHSHIDEKTCSHCQGLDGITVAVGETFPEYTGTRVLGTYGPLLGPPRHPSCRCWLTPSLMV